MADLKHSYFSLLLAVRGVQDVSLWLKCTKPAKRQIINRIHEQYMQSGVLVPGWSGKKGWERALEDRTGKGERNKERNKEKRDKKAPLHEKQTHPKG